MINFAESGSEEGTNLVSYNKVILSLYEEKMNLQKQLDEEKRNNNHLRVGYKCGKEKTCGKKINYKSKETAEKAVEAMKKKGSKEMECYPCIFCDGWHIGRKMNVDNLFLTPKESENNV